jgi:4-hydroxy-tetrahydrodipicolinate synthase
MAKAQVDWHGLFAVIVTPFSEDGGLDEAAYRKVVDLVIDAGCHGVIAAGSTGEFYLMDAGERGRVFDIAVDQAAGRVPVLGCPAALGIDEAVAHTQRAAAAGCAGVMALTPIYASLSDAEITAFYARLSAEGGLPIMLYNSPKLVNNNLSTGLVSELMELDNVAAIKDTTWDIYTTMDFVRCCSPQLKVFVGLEDILLPALAVGAVGAVAMMPQVVGRITRDLYDAVQDGDLERARPKHEQLVRAYDIFKVGSGYVGIKEAMNLLGRPGGHSRPPMLPYSEPQRDELRAILRDLDLLN